MHTHRRSPSAPLVSIVMACYNASAFIRDTVASIQAQTLENWELIAVDDCSKDDTRALLHAMAAQDGRIVVLQHERNSGRPGLARNTGLQRAQGRYICFIDSDDIYLPHRLERLVSLLERQPQCVAAFSNMEYISASGAAQGALLRSFLADAADHLHALEQQAYHLGERFFLFQCLRYCAAHTNTCTIARDRIGSVNLRFDPDLTIGEDKDLWIRLALHGSFAYVDEVLAQYRMHEHNITKGELRWALDVATLAARNAARRDDRITPQDRRLLRDFEATALRDLGWVYRKAGHHGQALQAYARSMRRQPRFDTLVHTLRAWMPVRAAS